MERVMLVPSLTVSKYPSRLIYFRMNFLFLLEEPMARAQPLARRASRVLLTTSLRSAGLICSRSFR